MFHCAIPRQSSLAAKLHINIKSLFAQCCKTSIRINQGDQNSETKIIEETFIQMILCSLVAVANYKFSGLKQHICYFRVLEARKLAWCLLYGNRGVGKTAFLSGGSKDKPISFSFPFYTFCLYFVNSAFIKPSLN